MTLSDLAALGSFVSGVAVLVSLVFLYFQLGQVRAQMAQAEKNQRALMGQGAIDRTISLNTWISEHSALFLKSTTQPETLTDEEAFQLSTIVRNLVLNFHDYHLQHEMGLADRGIYENTVLSLQAFLAFPAYRASYRIRRLYYAPEVRQLIDAMIETLPLQSRISPAERLRVALAELHAAEPRGTAERGALGS
jgi:hypothetical protein